MAADSAQSVPGFPPALEACLKEDACVRADGGQLKRKLEQSGANAEQVREATALPGRLLAALGRRKGTTPTAEEAAAVFARETVLRRQAQESERLLHHYTVKLDALLTAYLHTAVPAFLQQNRARVRLAEWERIVADLRADLRELVKMLGQARNNVVTGYNHSTHMVSYTARELLDHSSGLIRNVDMRVKQANAKATELGGLPGITIIPLQETITGLMKLEIGPMLREFDRVVRELEAFEQHQLVDLQIPAVRSADALVTKSHIYLANYREQLRAHYDKHITPQEIMQAIPGILERFRSS